jgi:two-component sensor histidine kinase
MTGHPNSRPSYGRSSSQGSLLPWSGDRISPSFYNDAFRPILGTKQEALGRSFADIWAEAWDDIGPIADRAFSGEATYIENFPLLINRFGASEQAYFTFSYSPLRLADGTVAGFIDTVVETTETVKTRADLALVNEELGHRLKNTLALVDSIAAQTLRGVTEQDAVAALRDRLVALGQAHDILLGQDWSGSSLGAVVHGTLKRLDGLGQIVVEGPDLEIGSRATMTFSLILHELATNATKYGALSLPNGGVSLSWAIEREVLRLRWREFNGPRVEQPTRTGFGSRLIDRGLSGSEVVRRYLSEGFELDLEIPLSTLRDS